jgi:hypothetical protein
MDQATQQILNDKVKLQILNQSNILKSQNMGCKRSKTYLQNTGRVDDISNIMDSTLLFEKLTSNSGCIINQYTRNIAVLFMKNQKTLSMCNLFQSRSSKSIIDQKFEKAICKSLIGYVGFTQLWPGFFFNNP